MGSGDLIPQVVWDPDADEHRWRIGSVLLTAETEYATAGWHEHFPAHPPTLADADPACFDPTARLQALDRSGIAAQVIYPNLIGFDSHSFLAELGPDLATEATRVYNDFLDEFVSADRHRLIPVGMLPYWDLQASIDELERIREKGFPGVLMAALLSRLGERNLSDPFWDPLLARIQEAGMSVNLHIGFNMKDRDKAERDYKRRTKTALAARTNRISFVKLMATANASVMEATADLILNGTFDRFPELKVVSVESGFGYIPFLLDNLDWHWQTSSAVHQFPERKLPSEYWRQNFFSTFWFEHSSLALLEDFQDNVMFETDFPHETGLFPGCWEHNRTAREQAARHVEGVVSPEVAFKVLAGNAAKLYGIDLEQAVTTGASA
jgi:predicted TIM-barrel fold metal-dependent hydrolase